MLQLCLQESTHCSTCTSLTEQASKCSKAVFATRSGCAGVTLAIDDCYDVWGSGIISIPWDFSIQDLKPQLLKMLGSSSLQPKAPLGRVKTEAVYASAATNRHSAAAAQLGSIALHRPHQAACLTQCSYAARSHAQVQATALHYAKGGGPCAQSTLGCMRRGDQMPRTRPMQCHYKCIRSKPVASVLF